MMAAVHKNTATELDAPLVHLLLRPLRLPAASSRHMLHGVEIGIVLSILVQAQARHRLTVPPGHCRGSYIRGATLASFL